jgi:hypothetical protein
MPCPHPKDAPPPEWQVELDSQAPPGDVIPALAALLLDLVEREAEAPPPAGPGAGLATPPS